MASPAGPVAADLSAARFVVYWDIDGTLLTTARAGVPALEDAAEVVTGHRPDLSIMTTAGLTDRMIARAVMGNDEGDRAGTVTEQAFLDAYAAALPQRLDERRGQVLPGVRDCLDGLAARGDVANVLLTGNIRRGAEAKLASYDLLHYFTTGGFAEDGHQRPEIAVAAIRRATELHGSAARKGALVGDTPHDVAAGRAVGLRVVAVGNAAHPTEELRAQGAWWAVDRAPSASELIARLEADNGGAE